MKKKKQELKFTIYDPNSPEKTLELLKKTIAESLKNKKQHSVLYLGG